MLILSFLHSLTTEFVVVVIGDIFSCHAVDNPDFESEMVSSKFQFSLLIATHFFYFGLACVAGVQRGGRGENEKREARSEEEGGERLQGRYCFLPFFTSTR